MVQERKANFEALRPRANVRRSSLPEISPLKYASDQSTTHLLDKGRHQSHHNIFEQDQTGKDFTLAGATIEGSKDYQNDKSSVGSQKSKLSAAQRNQQYSQSRPNLHMLDILKSHQTQTARDLKKIRIRARINSVLQEQSDISQRLLASECTDQSRLATSIANACNATQDLFSAQTTPHL